MSQVSTPQTFARSLRANWLGVAANGVVSLFLSKFVYRAMGEDLYGLWVLVVSLTGYLGLVELGMRSSLGRYINYYLGRGEIDEVNDSLSTAIAFFLACGFPLLIAAGLIGTNFAVIFPKIDLSALHGTTSAVLLVTLGLWLTFFSAVFTQVLWSQDRFDVYNLISVLSLGVRAIGTVFVLRGGRGIVALAGVQAAASGTSLVGSYIASRIVFQPMSLRATRVHWHHFRELAGFAIWAFIAGVGIKIMYNTDLVLIGMVLGSGRVPYYNIPIMLIVYSREFVGQIAAVLTPQAMKHCGAGEYTALRYIFRWGSKVMMALAIPFYAGLILLGPEFMTLFWGPKFQQSRWALILLAMGQLVVMAVQVGRSIIYGLGYVRFGAAVTLIQAAANLTLTLIFLLVFRMGLVGVALGTLIPIVTVNLFVAVVVLKRIHFPPLAFLRENVWRWALGVAILFALVGVKWQVSLQGYLRWTPWLESDWVRLGIKTVVFAVGATAINLFVVFTRTERKNLWRQLRRMFRREPLVTPPTVTNKPTD